MPDSKLMKIVGIPEFPLTKAVLELVYVQVILWLGIYFAPLMSFMGFITLVILFYLKKLTVLRNYKPASQPYKSSKTHFFFMIMLLISYILCCIPIGWAIYFPRPSLTCGPFKPYETVKDVFTITITTWPTLAQHVINGMLNSAAIVLYFVVLLLAIYLFYSASQMKTDYIEMLKARIGQANNERQYLLQRLNEYEQASRTSLRKKDDNQPEAPSATGNYNTFGDPSNAPQTS